MQSKWVQVGSVRRFDLVSTFKPQEEASEVHGAWQAMASAELAHGGDCMLAHLVDVADGRLDARVPGVRGRGRRASEEIGGVMVIEAIRELALARKEVGVALDALAVGGRVEGAAPACARAVEGLCAALTELAGVE